MNIITEKREKKRIGGQDLDEHGAILSQILL